MKWLMTILVFAMVATAGTDAVAAPGPAPTPRAFAVTVLPTFAGLQVTIGNATAKTNRNGVAHFASVPVGAKLVNQVHVTSTTFTQKGRGVRVEQARVLDQGGTVTLNVYYEVRFAFEKGGGTTFGAANLSTVTLKSTTGDLKTVSPTRPAWLFGTRVVPLAGSLTAKDVTWSVQDVPYRGSNLVHSSQQRFIPSSKAVVHVSLLFFAARLRIYDAFFGFGQGSQVQLRFPDGSTKRYPISNDGTVNLASLPRATYQMRIIGPGPGMTRAVALSRDQNMQLKFYSWLDVAVVLVVGLGLCVGLVAVGWHRRRRHRAQRASAQPRCLVEAATVGGGHLVVFTAEKSQRHFVQVSRARTLSAFIAACERAWAHYGGVFPVVVPIDLAVLATDRNGGGAPRRWRCYAQLRGVRVEASSDDVPRAVPALLADCYAGVIDDVAQAQQIADDWCRKRDADRVPGGHELRAHAFDDLERAGLLPLADPAREASPAMQPDRAGEPVLSGVGSAPS